MVAHPFGHRRQIHYFFRPDEDGVDHLVWNGVLFMGREQELSFPNRYLSRKRPGVGRGTPACCWSGAGTRRQTRKSGAGCRARLTGGPSALPPDRLRFSMIESTACGQARARKMFRLATGAGARPTKALFAVAAGTPWEIGLPEGLTAIGALSSGGRRQRRLFFGPLGIRQDEGCASSSLIGERDLMLSHYMGEFMGIRSLLPSS